MFVKKLKQTKNKCCLSLFLLVNGALFVHISLLIQMRQLFHWRAKTVWSSKSLNDGSNTQLLTSQDVHQWLDWCGLLVDYCDVFISSLDSHSDGTHSLQSIQYWASNGMTHFSKSIPMEKYTHPQNILDGLRVSTSSLLGKILLLTIFNRFIF